MYMYIWLNDVLPAIRRQGGIIGSFGYFITSLSTNNGDLVLVLGVEFYPPMG